MELGSFFLFLQEQIQDIEEGNRHSRDQPVLLTVSFGEKPRYEANTTNNHEPRVVNLTYLIRRIYHHVCGNKLHCNLIVGNAPAHGALLFINAVPITKLFAVGGGGKVDRLRATEDHRHREVLPHWWRRA